VHKRIILLENTGKLDASQRHPNREATLKILQRYIFREWLWTLLAVVIILLIAMIGVSFGEILNDVAGGRVPAGLIWLLMGLEMPRVLGTILPLSVFVAVIWGLGRNLMLRPLFSLLLPVSALLLLIGLFLTPAASSIAQNKLEEAFRNAAEWGLQTGQFHVLQGGDLVLYVASVDKDGRTLRHVFIEQRNNEREQVWIAEKGYYWLDEETGDRYLTLENGQITEGGAGKLDFGVMEFTRNDLKLPKPQARVRAEKLDARPSGELFFAEDPEEAAELQWRLSPAVAALVLGLLAIPLSHSSPREGRGGRVVLGIFVYASYANILYISRDWVANGDVPVPIGIWWVHLLAFGVALIWLRRQGRMVGKG
jgi:lipopolysaccharide export system permease protein